MKKLLRVLMITALAAALLLLPCLAAGDAPDAAGNRISGADFTGEAESDLYAFEEDVRVANATVGESVIAMGKNISVTGTDVGGSLRAAGYTVTVDDSTAAVNATVAGYSVTLGPDMEARGMFAAGNLVSFAGKCDSLYVGASTATISGEVTGDAYISAGNVTITDSAVISGTLTVDSAKAPSIAKGAKVGNLVYNASGTQSGEAPTRPAPSPFVAALKSLCRSIPAALLLAVVYFFVAPVSVKKAGEMVTERPAAMLLGGLVGLICVPIAAVLLIITVIGIPAGISLLLLYAIVLICALSFTAFSVARRVLPNMHWLLAALIGAAGFCVVSKLPYIGGLLGFACAVFAMGYLIQTVYAAMKKKPEAEAVPAIAEEAGSTPENGEE